MATIPFILSCDGQHFHRHRLHPNQDLGLPFPPEHLVTAAIGPMIGRDCCRPWQMSAGERDVGSTIKSDKDKFHVTVDVQHFAPEEITVKTVDDYVVIEGKHEEKKDEHGFISRQFTRKYALPEGCDPETVESKLSSDGVLSIIAPRVAAPKNERNVPITHTGPVRKEVRDQNSPYDDGPSDE